ncbi:MAG: ribonuclease P protein component, partial [Firmicutes bacterium]|nr:ribonuclease P protein component [Bacillota bacterium]
MKFTESLKKNYQFRFVYNRGKSIANRQLVMYIYPNGTMCNRLGISVSKKVGKSVVRSRVTRLIRESYRLVEDKVSKGYDIIVIARTGVNGLPFCDVQKSVVYLLKKQGLYDSQIKNQA